MFLKWNSTLCSKIRLLVSFSFFLVNSDFFIIRIVCVLFDVTISYFRSYLNHSDVNIEFFFFIICQINLQSSFNHSHFFRFFFHFVEPRFHSLLHIFEQSFYSEHVIFCLILLLFRYKWSQYFFISVSYFF